MLNSEKLDTLLVHLTDVCAFVRKYPEFFSDVPTQTTVVQHNIDVVGAAPVKQHAYRVNPTNGKIMPQEVSYLLEHGFV